MQRIPLTISNTNKTRSVQQMWCNLIFPNISMTSIRYQLPRVFFGFLENELCYLTFFSLVWYCSSMIQSSLPQTSWSITKKQIVTLVSSSTFNFTGCPVLWTPNPSLMHTALKPHYIEISSKMNRDLFSNQSKLF